MLSKNLQPTLYELVDIKYSKICETTKIFEVTTYKANMITIVKNMNVINE